MTSPTENNPTVLPAPSFTPRTLWVAFLVVLASLIMGVLGYHFAEDMPWIDALLNASMILGGMGPVGELHSVCGKLFASFYALYSCFIVLGLISIMMTPAIHKALRKYHLEPKHK